MIHVRVAAVVLTALGLALVPAACGKLYLDGVVSPDAGTGGCAAGESLCGEACVSLGKDPANCGECGHTCEAHEVCSLGACADACADDTFIICDGACIDAVSDAKHCGGCPNACADDQVCSSGVCTTTCSEGRVLCGQDCVVIAQNPLHCGGCGVVCSGESFCSAGKCVCEPGHMYCNGQCVDTDHACGQCGNVCPEGATCHEGECRCFDGEICDGACVDIDENPEHCGGCDKKCGSNEICIGGNCF